MGFSDRGGDGGFSSLGGTNSSSIEPGTESRYVAGRGLFRYYAVVPLDNTYVLMQMFATFCVIIGIIMFILFNYKSSIPDPITTIKTTYLLTYSLITLAILITSLVLGAICKDKFKLIEKLKIIVLVSIIIMSIFGIVKLNLNQKYTEEFFEQYYRDNYSYMNHQLDLNIEYKKFKIMDNEQYFVSKNIDGYHIFTIRNYGIILIQVILDVFTIYQIIKLSNINTKKQRLDKDDIILYDEEENIKF